MKSSYHIYIYIPGQLLTLVQACAAKNVVVGCKLEKYSTKVTEFWICTVVIVIYIVLGSWMEQ